MSDSEKSTTPLRFEGHSDDTFGEYGRTGDDYDNCASGDPIVWCVKAATWETCGECGQPHETGATGLYVIGQYAPGNRACWSIAIQQLDADVPLPEWEMRFETASSGYSPALLIDAPAEATVTLEEA